MKQKQLRDILVSSYQESVVKGNLWIQDLLISQLCILPCLIILWVRLCYVPFLLSITLFSLDLFYV